VVSYAVDEGVEWTVLTNGWMWQLYHIAFERPISVELVGEADLLGKDRTPAVDLLYLITKEGVAAGKAAEYWATKLALSTPNLVKALLSEPVINAMRREFRRITGQRLSGQELAALLLSQVISPGAAGVGGLKTVFAPTGRRRTRKAIEGYSVDRLLEGKAGEVVELFRSLAREILSLSSEIEEVPSKLYVSYKRGRNFCECVIQKKKLLLHLDIPHRELKDPRGIAQDYANIGHYGTGETQVSVSPGADLQYVLDLVRQAHDLTL
jgi:predicted transport protein